MLGKKTTIIKNNVALRAAILSLLILSPTVFSFDKAPIPAVSKEIDTWLKAAVTPVAGRKAILDPALVAAEAAPVKVIKVSKDGKGDFDTITKAVNSVPAGNKKRVIISIAPGKYVEKVKIERTKPFITFMGQSKKNLPVISFNGDAKTYGTVDSASLIIESDYFMGVNLIIKNTSPKPDGKREGAQAVACRVSGEKAAFYNCKFIGFQDTLCDDRGFHFFMDCYIEGTVDFIFGSGTSLYLRSEIYVIGNHGMTVITAHARETEAEKTGYSFVHCKITGETTGAFLGRAWKTMPRVIYSYTNMGKVVSDAGWSNDNKPDRDRKVFYGEYKCFGEGADTNGRYEPTKMLSDAQAAPFLHLDYINGYTWLLPPPTL